MTVAPTLAMLRQCRTTAQRSFFIEMVTLAGLEPATSPAPARTRTLYPPLSYSAVIILMTVCGGARADTRLEGRVIH